LRVLDASPETLWRAGVAALTCLVAVFLFARLMVWPPHEDETLALFTGRGSVGELWRTVLGERGGAPLHFLFAWAIAVPSWMLLFHGVYARMYSMFLFTATLSYLALLFAVERRTRRAWAL